MTFASGENYSSLYEPYPRTVPGLSSDQLRISVIEVRARRQRLATIRSPELLLPNRFAVLAPPNAIINCPQSMVFAISDAMDTYEKEAGSKR